MDGNLSGVAQSSESSWNMDHVDWKRDFSDAKDEIDMIEMMEQENEEKTEKEGGGYRNGFTIIFQNIKDYNS